MKMIRLTLIAFMVAVLSLVQYAEAASALTEKGYQLEKVLIFSRHNIRSPLTAKGSITETMTPNKWFKWTAPAGQLSLHGGMAETSMGQYFRKYLEDEGFMPENWQPEDNQVRFYSNSLQRTIATAQYFSSGMLPIANVRVERKMELNTHDPVFIIENNDRGEKLLAKIVEDNNQKFGADRSGLCDAVAEDIPVWERIMDFKNSAYAKEKGVANLDGRDLVMVTRPNGVIYKGMLKDAFKTCDALMMQYYEIPDNKKAAFGNEATDKDFQQIAHMFITNSTPYWDNPYEAWFISKNLLKEINSELGNKQRKFTFMCGHDSNLRPMLINMKAEDFKLPGTIAYTAPIGGKIVIEKRLKDGVEYANVNFIYESDKQIRNLEILDLENPPMIYPLNFQGMTKNEDGLYLFSDVVKRINEAVHRYDELS